MLQDYSWMEKIRSAPQEPQEHFVSTLRHLTKRQVDVDHEAIEERFNQRQREQEQKALRAQQAEENRANAIRASRHAATLQRFEYLICESIILYLLQIGTFYH